MTALLLALGQLDDPAFFGVLWRSAGLALLSYVTLLAISVWGVHAALAFAAWPAWLAGLLAAVGIVVLAFWLFLPTVMLIAYLYSDRVALAVDSQHYPFLPPPSPAALPVQLWEGVALALQVLVLNGLALLLAFLPVPGIGLVLALLVSGWAIGRGLFVAVAMRRMGRGQAMALYADRRWAVLVPGMLLSVAALVPGLNLLVPIVGTAAMVHVLNRAITTGQG